jgi:hypothetical protein
VGQWHHAVIDFPLVLGRGSPPERLVDCRACARRSLWATTSRRRGDQLSLGSLLRKLRLRARMTQEVLAAAQIGLPLK